MYRKRFIHTTWRHGGHVRLGCIIDFVWFFWSCLNWPNTTDPTIYNSNNMIYTIVLSITYKLSPSPHIRMWKKYFTYKINFRIISHTCMCMCHLIWSENAFSKNAFFENAFFENFANFWRARSRLYQNEISQENMRLTAFVKLYKVCILLHRCNLKNPEKMGLKNQQFSWKFSNIFCKCCEIWKCLPNFKKFS